MTARLSAAEQLQIVTAITRDARRRGYRPRPTTVLAALAASPAPSAPPPPPVATVAAPPLPPASDPLDQLRAALAACEAAKVQVQEIGWLNYQTRPLAQAFRD
jgi:hypothetical protein